MTEKWRKIAFHYIRNYIMPYIVKTEWESLFKSLKFEFDMLTVLFKFCDASVEHNSLKRCFNTF